MTNTPDFIVISLADQMSFLRSTYREYVLRAMNSFTGQGLPPFQSWNYDGIDFMNALIHEISFMEQPAESLGQLPKSTEILVKAGFDPKTATWISCEIFKSIVDTIATYFPDASFGPYGTWDFNLVNECDLSVSKPSTGQHAPTHYTVVESSPPTAVPGPVLSKHPVEFDWSDLSSQPPARMLTTSEIDAMGKLD